MDNALRDAISVADKNENISVDDLKNFVIATCKD
jgi:hypothetical protein